MKKAPQGPKQLPAFCNNYAAACLIVAALLFSASSFGQSAPTRSQLQDINALGYKWQSGAFRKTLYVPLDTPATADSGAVAYLAGQFWFKNSTHWLPLSKTIYALNGVHKDGDTIKLGSPLTEPTDINNNGNSLFIHGTGENTFKTVSGTFEATTATSSAAASLSAGNSSTNSFSEINSTDEAAITNAGINGLFYNYHKLDSSGFNVVMKANTTPITFKITNLGKMSNSAYT
jgi:hypothetical protein